jgi:hypothetical protein
MSCAEGFITLHPDEWAFSVDKHWSRPAGQCSRSHDLNASVQRNADIAHIPVPAGYEFKAPLTFD